MNPTDAPIPSNRFKEAFDRLHTRRWAVSQRTAAERLVVIEKLRAAIVERREALIAALHQDLRKPRMEVELSELHPALEEIDRVRANLADWMLPRPVPATLLLTGTRSEVRFEARGVVLILGTWNYPFNLLIIPLVSALAAGNCVAVKLSEKAPATSRFLAALIEAVCDPAEVAVFEGEVEVGEALLQLPFDHIFFTGSTRIGRKVMAAAAQHLATVTLELGGKSPAIVDRGAELGEAARRIVWGRFVNAGQTCIAPDHVWVHESIEQPFLAAVRASIEAFYGASEADRRASPDFARIIDAASVSRLSSLVERSVAAGAVLELGGTFDPGERYASPTVLSKVSPEAPIMGEEIFGPVLPVLTYRELPEVYRAVERMGKPLALYVFAKDSRVIEQVLASTSAGATVVNNALLHFVNQGLPYGGVGASGMGSYHGVHGFQAFSHARAVLVQRRPALGSMLYPPFRGRVSALAARFMKLLE